MEGCKKIKLGKYGINRKNVGHSLFSPFPKFIYTNPKSKPNFKQDMIKKNMRRIAFVTLF